MTTINTKRLQIKACTLEIAQALVFGSKITDSLDQIIIPDHWPTDEIKSILPFYIERLENVHYKPRWSFWLIIHNNDRRLIGSVLFKENGHESGIVELGYEIVDAYQKQGFGYEAIQALVSWVFATGRVNVIFAECDQENVGSIRLLEKLGMRCTELNPPFIRWELSKTKKGC
ncbi:GNAT family N-acetyltransferase [Calidifontibacillus oryziterrae]|uniref:GNAT family N-acetyltransferase n=1 Tax=Calidifontibacillus oryziterrae TaxID=1191699 RepID=UPI0002EF2191|nr:GNAT family N-acetyltransferase [Calidifontibacillus oryziterrae]